MNERALDRSRLDRSATRRLHKLKRWSNIRFATFRRDHFTCQICGRIEGDMSKLICDHVEPHRGDVVKFWTGPFQTLCKPCHDVVKQKEEVADRSAGLDVYGARPAAYRPDWLRPSAIPLTIVCGPPAAGKNHYMLRHAIGGDLLIDLDAIAHELSGEPMHSWARDRWLNPALRRRNDLLGQLSKDPSWPAAWLIMTEPKAERRQWWADKLQPKAVIVLETSETRCVAHAALDSDRDRHRTGLMIRRWWSEYSRRDDDLIIAA